MFVDSVEILGTLLGGRVVAHTLFVHSADSSAHVTSIARKRLADDLSELCRALRHGAATRITLTPSLLIVLRQLRALDRRPSDSSQSLKSSSQIDHDCVDRSNREKKAKHSHICTQDHQETCDEGGYLIRQLPLLTEWIVSGEPLSTELVHAFAKAVGFPYPGMTQHDESSSLDHCYTPPTAGGP